MKIDVGVPIPRKPSTNRNLEFDAIEWSALGVGDSFVLESKSSGGLHKRATKAGIEIEIRAIAYDDGRLRKVAKAFRVWRIK